MRRDGPYLCAAAPSCWISMSTAHSAASSARRGGRRGGCILGGVVEDEMAVGDGVCWSGLTLGNLAAGVWSGAVRGFAVVGAVSSTLGDGLVAMGKFRFENLRWVYCRIVRCFLCRADQSCSSSSSIRFLIIFPKLVSWYNVVSLI